MQADSRREKLIQEIVCKEAVKALWLLNYKKEALDILQKFTSKPNQRGGAGDVMLFTKQLKLLV